MDVGIIEAEEAGAGIVLGISAIVVGPMDEGILSNSNLSTSAL